MRPCCSSNSNSNSRHHTSLKRSSNRRCHHRRRRRFALQWPRLQREGEAFRDPALQTVGFGWAKR